jgi:hypothetical protein
MPLISSARVSASSANRIALIATMTSPSVCRTYGRNRNSSVGRTSALTRPNTAASQSTASSPCDACNSNPGRTTISSPITTAFARYCTSVTRQPNRAVARSPKSSRLLPDGVGDLGTPAPTAPLTVVPAGSESLVRRPSSRDLGRVEARDELTLSPRASCRKRAVRATSVLTRSGRARPRGGARPSGRRVSPARPPARVRRARSALRAGAGLWRRRYSFRTNASVLLPTREAAHRPSRC